MKYETPGVSLKKFCVNWIALFGQYVSHNNHTSQQTLAVGSKNSVYQVGDRALGRKES